MTKTLWCMFYMHNFSLLHRPFSVSPPHRWEWISALCPAISGYWGWCFHPFDQCSAVFVFGRTTERKRGCSQLLLPAMTWAGLDLSCPCPSRHWEVDVWVPRVSTLFQGLSARWALWNPCVQLLTGKKWRYPLGRSQWSWSSGGLGLLIHSSGEAILKETGRLFSYLLVLLLTDRIVSPPPHLSVEALTPQCDTHLETGNFKK